MIQTGFQPQATSGIGVDCVCRPGWVGQDCSQRGELAMWVGQCGTMWDNVGQCGTMWDNGREGKLTGLPLGVDYHFPASTFFRLDLTYGLLTKVNICRIISLKS